MGVIFGLIALGGFTDAAIADRVVAVSGAIILIAAFRQWRLRRAAALGEHDGLLRG